MFINKFYSICYIKESIQSNFSISDNFRINVYKQIFPGIFQFQIILGKCLETDLMEILKKF